MDASTLKERIPYPLKQAIKYAWGAIPLPIRYGKVFRDTYKFLQKSQWWSEEQLKAYQLQQMTPLLHHAYHHVPYYRRMFQETGLTPADIKSFDDLRRLPYLTRDVIGSNSSDLVADNYSSSELHEVRTGGTTGCSIRLYWQTGVTVARDWAHVWRQWNWAGYKFGERRVVLRGNLISKFKDGRRHWREYDPRDTALVLSTYVMTEQQLPEYIEAINRFKPVAIQGYPSSLSILAGFLRRNKLHFRNIRCILTSSETLYPNQRGLIEEQFGANIFDHYGSAEGCALIMQCENGKYHVISDYGIVTLLDKNNRPITTEGEAGEIVATGLNNYAMPIINYRTEDMAVYTGDSCSCGRRFPLVQRIDGRLQECVIDRAGNLLTGINLLQAAETIVGKFDRYQFVQHTRGSIAMRIVPKAEISASDIENVRKTFADLYPAFDLEIEFVEEIPRTARGKYRTVVQNLATDFVSI